MNRVDFLHNLKSPLPNAVLKKYPTGNIMQLWGENPQLYSAGMDALHTALGGHVGIDIASAFRDPVYAAHDGQVVSANGDRTNQGGLQVLITSPELDEEELGNSRIQTVYCHLDEFVVHIGQFVKQGELIGYEGNTGFVVSGGTAYWGNAPAGKGVHLHFGLYEDIKRNGTWERRYKNVLRDSVDPLPWLTGDLSGTAILLRNINAFLTWLRRT